MKNTTLLLPALSLCAGATAVAQEQPNVLFIIIDDMGSHQLESYGSTYYETPNIDRIANDGMRFTQAYTGAPVSSPTRASIMAGSSPARLHLTDWLNGNAEPDGMRLTCPAWKKGLDEDMIHLPQMMQEAGYATSLIGKWHLAVSVPGFDEIHREDGPKSSSSDPDRHRVKEYTDEAIDFITRKKDEPFFLFLSHNTIHTPESEMSALVQKYASKADSRNNGFNNPVQGAMVETLDNETGRLLDSLTELGLDDNTIVIFYSDNGQYSPNQKIGVGSPLRGSKVTLWEGGVRVPLMVRWNGHITPSTTNDAQVISYDFLPTIAELCDIKSPRLDDIEGLSFASQLVDESPKALDRDYLCWNYPHYHYEDQFTASIRKGDWKLIENYDESIYFKDGAFELYYLKDDVNESNNLVKSNPEKAAELYNDLCSWRKDVKAQMPYNKREIYGVEHYKFHQINETAKVNEFEIQSNVDKKLEFDDEGTFMSLQQGVKLNYLFNVAEAGEYDFNLLSRNAAAVNSSIKVTISGGGENFSKVITVDSQWSVKGFTQSLSQGIYNVEFQILTGEIEIDKWVITDYNTPLVHDGTMADVEGEVIDLISFEADETPIYSAIVGNAVQQDPLPEVIDNPYKEGLNKSNKVLHVRSKQDKDNGIPSWNGNAVAIKLKEPLVCSEENKFLHILHWKESVLNSWLIYGSDDNGATYVELGRGTVPAAKEWFDMVVDASLLEKITHIRILMDGNWGGTNGSNLYPPTNFYYDEFMLNNSYLPREVSVEGGDDVVFKETPLITFESGEDKIYTSITGNDAQQEQTPAIVDNPFWSDENSTSSVLYVRSKQDVANLIPAWSQNVVNIKLKEPVDCSGDERYLHLMHWREQKLNCWLMYGSNDNGATYKELGRGTAPEAQMWFDMVVDASSVGNLTNIRIYLDGNWSGTGESRYYAPADFYYDELVLSNNSTPRTIVSSVKDMNLESKTGVAYWSNPIKDELKVKSVKPMANISIYSIAGAMVKSVLLDGATSSNINLMSEPKGIYIVSLQFSDGTTMNERVIKL